jgi:gag-polypeptide of LTR copia-type/Domain of unknown function (DUF4219)
MATPGGSDLALSVFEQIPAFDGSNYRSWSFSMKMLLKARELWDVIEDETTNVTRESTSEGTPEGGTQPRRDAVWHKKDQLALSSIVLSLKPAEQEQVYDCQTAKEAWTHLQEVYKGKGMHRLLSLLKQLSTAQLEKNTASLPGSNTIKDYICSMIQTADEIAAIGYKLDWPVVIAFILNGLPETFRYLVVNLKSQVDIISFQDLQAQLLDEDKRIQEIDEAENKSTAFNAKYKKPSEYYCDHCEKKGHTAERCFKKPGNIRCGFCGRVGHNENVCRARIYHESKESKDKKNGSDDEHFRGTAFYSAG